MARLPRLATPRLTIHDLGALADALAEPLDDHTIALLRGRSNCTVILVR